MKILNIWQTNVHFLKKKHQQKNRQVKVWWKFDESFTESFSGHMKVSLKLSLKLSGDIWNFHEIFTSYMKLSWKFHYMHETLMKLSLHAWHFHEHFRCELKISIIFHWNFHVATESFSETFSKLSANFDIGDFSIKQVHEEMYAFCFNIYQKQMDHNSILRTMYFFNEHAVRRFQEMTAVRQEL